MLIKARVYCSLNHFFVVRGQRCPSSYLPRKLHAIQNINTELQRMPSDHSVVAVAMMTLLEVCRSKFPVLEKETADEKQCLAGEPAEWMVHKQGLHLMIRSRGGTEKLGLDGAAQRVISW